MKLIHFFERKQTSLRRCEELPWHLKICRRWFSLKSFVSDLKTFKIMSEVIIQKKKSILLILILILIIN